MIAEQVSLANRRQQAAPLAFLDEPWFDECIDHFASIEHHG